MLQWKFLIACKTISSLIFFDSLIKFSIEFILFLINLGVYNSVLTQPISEGHLNSSIARKPGIIPRQTAGKSKKLQGEAFSEKTVAWPFNNRFETQRGKCSGCSLLGLEKEVARLRSDLQEYQLILPELKISLIRRNEEIAELRKDLVVLQCELEKRE